MTAREPLRLFLPGAFAGLPDDLRTAFATVAPEGDLWFHAFVPSGILASEILAGAVADVAVSANPRFMTDLWQEGLVPALRVLAGNRLCVIVRSNAGKDVVSLDDLTRDDVRVVTPQSVTDPCGQYVAEMFERAGIADVMRRKQETGTLIHSIGSGDLPAFLFDGRADAGVFYASEAQTLGDRVTTLALQAELDFRERIVFVIGAVIRPERAHPLAQVYVDFFTGAEGQALLTRHGFLPAASVAMQCFPWEL
jgi:molybdate transport system substrate-binding protein